MSKNTLNRNVFITLLGCLIGTLATVLLFYFVPFRYAIFGYAISPYIIALYLTLIFGVVMAIVNIKSIVGAMKNKPSSAFGYGLLAFGWVYCLFALCNVQRIALLGYAIKSSLIVGILFAIYVVILGVFHYKAVFAWVKERLRKFVVSLKRNPSVIPLIVMLVAFGIYSFNLTNVSDTTAQLQAKNMGLCQFCIMLFSILTMVCLLNAFPRRKKANLPIIGVAFALFAIEIVCSFFYRSGVMSRVKDPAFNINLDDYPFIVEAYNAIGLYMILVVVTAVLVVTLPLYSKLLKMINTSVAVEDNGSMGEIEISE